ncbi:patatin-like phospholipase family protein [Caulobacter mirabilis]|uniref:Cyclic nucleotide-binding protein n=1 Tax=Caulobacter mirabilis TaxID=69666 RepID=A0A2D2AXB9_9CAUL|nr:patatin-like phospholipase family protein [Caulobacter mirabilis]ATQ42625.1 cyclic nucleotide-binding protein [Caulobacter mirabilis]
MFALERLSGAARWFSLPGGAHLYDAGEAASELYLVQAGRLGAFRREEGQERQFLGVIRPGEPAGEMALIAGTPHSGQVVALRDSEILALSRDDFFAAAEADPAVMTELARLMILRTRQAAGQASLGEPSVYGFIAAGPGRKIRPLVEKIALEIARQDHSVTVVGSEAANAPTEWFSNTEADYDYVLYAAEHADDGWKSTVGRQVDRIFWVGHGDRPPPATVEAYASEPLQEQQLVDLILIQRNDCRRPQGSDAWLDAARATRLFHLREGLPADVARIARVLTGRSVGLVLSGGGARAYAHIGAIRALRERGVPIDFVGGASMGAIVAAALAMGWDQAEMERRIGQAFVESSPLDDIAIPLIAMTLGLKVQARLHEHFGETRIEDLWLPFFCVSSNLTTGGYQLHRRGKARKALRATIALPGVMPPAVDGDDVLVDGAVMKNFPADIMRSLQRGPIVGVDVTRGRSITADDVARPASVWRWLLSGEWRKGPPIVGLLMRAATVTIGRDLIAAREATDLLILPKVEAIDMRDWKAYGPAVEAGYRATLEALDRLDHPVTELRRRKG